MHYLIFCGKLEIFKKVLLLCKLYLISSNLAVEIDLNLIVVTVDSHNRPHAPADFDQAVPSHLDVVIHDLYTYVECFDFERLKEAVIANMRYFTCPPYHGYLNFIMSVVLSRGITRLKTTSNVNIKLQ